MSEEIANKVVPKLRFPEFRDSEEWTEETLNKVCEVNPSINNLPNSFVYIDLESVEDGKLLKKKIIQLEQAPSRAQRLLKPGDVIFQMVRPYQKNNFFFHPTDNLYYVASTGYAQLRAYKSKMYLFQYIHNQNFVDKVLTKCTGSNYPAINSNDLSEILIEIPKPEEQQKIADCLSSLDDLISAQNQKLEALKTYKKGMMQQLFPAEGETVPQLRFPEFRDSVDWEEKKLGDIADIKRGAASQHLKYVTDNYNGIRLLRINDFLSNVPVFVEDTEEMKRFRVKTNDLLIAGTGATAGITFIIPEKYNNLSYSYNAPRIRVHQEDTYFVYAYLKSDYILQQQKKLFVGNAQPFLDTNAIASFKLFIPSLPEQQKIANCLSSLDELITAQTEKIEVLKVHKKGLMQQLFPNITASN